MGVSKSAISKVHTVQTKKGKIYLLTTDGILKNRKKPWTHVLLLVKKRQIGFGENRSAGSKINGV